MTVVAFEPPAPEERITCRDCGMLLAVKWPGGGMRIVVVGVYVDKDGRLTCQCPNCGGKVRLMKVA